MERKTLKLIIFFFSINLVSCGYFENDKIDYQLDVIGKIKIQKQENSNDVNLVYSISDEIYASIVENCELIYYDSKNKKIYTKESINNFNNRYYEIEIVDDSSDKVFKAIKKSIINKKTFTNIINQCSNCIVKYHR